MFCLRSWIPILFFLLRTNASPIYLVLFISATYFLNRPCVYCSLLLFILVVALFDFHTPWFEPPLSDLDTNSALLPGNGTIAASDSFGETASVFLSAANATAQAVVKAAVEGIRNRTTTLGGGEAAGNMSGNVASYEWVKGLLGKKEWRIPCLDVLVRI